MSKGNLRKTGLECYYTSADEAKRLVGVAHKVIPGFTSFSFIAPSAGNGAFIAPLLEMGIKPEDIIASDIKPMSPGIRQADFLTDDLAQHLVPHTSYATIENPPFGRNNSLSVPFFNKLADYCEYIGFIVPRSFRKWSVQNRLDHNFHLLHDEDLSLTYHDEHGVPLLAKAGQLQTIFQVWERRAYQRPKYGAEDRGYIRRVSPEEADVALTVFGHSSGRIETDFPLARNATKMYLAVSDPTVIEALNAADLKQYSQNVAFVEALSMAEVRAALNQVYDDRT